MSKKNKSILYVRLPCWKIYPGGIVYIADYIHKQRPNVSQEIVDLALINKADRKEFLKNRLQDLKPDIVAFSWRNMQSFGPHPENDALDIVMAFDYSPKLLPRLKAAKGALSILYDYSSQRINNFNYMRMARNLLPDTQIVVGGTAVSLFADYIVDKCPTGTIVVVGEGEDSMLSIVDGSTTPVGDYLYKNKQGQIIKDTRNECFDLSTLTAVDFSYINSIFSGFKSYLKDEYIGVQTKRGCPYKCFFCVYNEIEGRRQRYRMPVEVAKEVETLNRDYGVKNVWFTDAQFCSTKKSVDHIEKILDEMISRKIKISWTGYLRLDYLTKETAKKMIESGICSIDTTFTGSQEVIDGLELGYSLKMQMEVFRMFKENGFTNQQIKLYMPLNAPNETEKTLKETVEKISELYAMFGRENVLPFIFFIGIQPKTPIERFLINEGYLQKNYNPLTLNPFIIKKLIYNPQPLGRIIGRAYLSALETYKKTPVSASGVAVSSGAYLKNCESGKKTDDYIGRVTIDFLSSKLELNNQ